MILFLLLITLAITSPAAGMVNGDIATRYTDVILYLEIPIYYSKLITCSGTLIAPNYILTAGHCW